MAGCPLPKSEIGNLRPEIVKQAGGNWVRQII